MDLSFNNIKIYNNLANEHYKKYKEYSKEVINKEIDSDKKYELKKEQNKCAICIIIFSTMAIESFINNYIITNLGKKYFDNLDRLDIKSKLVIGVKLITGYDYPKGRKSYSHLEKLVKLRNNIVHSKSKVIKDAKHNSLENIASEYIKNQLGSFDEEDIDNIIRVYDEIVNDINEIVDNKGCNEGNMSKTKQGKIGKCALCGQVKKLEISHIIPNFVSRRIIKKSPTGFMRSPYSPDQRVQDGTKEYLLCGDCEDRFNKWETIFANKVFHPYKEGKLLNFEYGDWLAKFILSVNWRTLYLDIISYIEQGNISIDYLNTILINERIIREYLLETKSDIGTAEVNMFLFGDIKEASQQIIDSRPHEFFYNSMFDYTNIIKTEYGTSIGVIANLSGILIYTIIKKLPIESSINTQVDLVGGKFVINNQHPTSSILSDTFNYMIESREKEKKISKQEQEKILNNLKKKGKYNESEVHKHKKKDDKLKNK